MEILVVSDLHVDVNRRTGLEFNFINKINENNVTLIAGDIAGGYREEEEFLDKLSQKIKSPVICIGGNHLGYNYDVLDYEVGTKEWSLEYLSKKYNQGSLIKYLNNSYLILDDYLVFGGTMYTDFALCGRQQVDNAGMLAEKYLNDFVYVYVKDKKVIRKVRYTDYIKWFNQFKRKLSACLKEYPDKKFIVLTHFAPSIKSVSEKYVGDFLNPVYAVNMDDYIYKHPQIKLWVHGHVHSSFDYNIGECRVVCEPYGYYGYEQYQKPKEFMGKKIVV